MPAGSSRERPSLPRRAFLGVDARTNQVVLSFFQPVTEALRAYGVSLI